MSAALKGGKSTRKVAKRLVQPKRGATRNRASAEARKIKEATPSRKDEERLTRPAERRRNSATMRDIELTKKLEGQEALLKELQEFCKKNNLPDYRAKKALRVLLGDDYIPLLSAPTEAEVRWSERFSDKFKHTVAPTLNPLQFYDEYWRKYEDEGVLDQKLLKNLDHSIFVAIHSYCQYHVQFQPVDYLPPPARGRSSTRVTTNSPSSAEGTADCIRESQMAAMSVTRAVKAPTQPPVQEKRPTRRSLQLGTP